MKNERRKYFEESSTAEAWFSCPNKAPLFAILQDIAPALHLSKDMGVPCHIYRCCVNRINSQTCLGPNTGCPYGDSRVLPFLFYPPSSLKKYCVINKFKSSLSSVFCLWHPTKTTQILGNTVRKHVHINDENQISSRHPPGDPFH